VVDCKAAFVVGCRASVPGAFLDQADDSCACQGQDSSLVVARREEAKN
jgi:hypothetical protein